MPRGGQNKILLDEQAVIAFYGWCKSLRKTALAFECSTPTITNVLKKHSIKRDGCCMNDPARRKRQSEILKEQHRNGMFKGEKHSQWKGGKVEVVCSICGVTMWRYPSYVYAGSEVLCGDECRAIFAKDIARNNQLGSLHGAEHPRWIDGRSLSGYKMLYMPKYSSSNTNGLIPAHRYIVEKYLGRLLSPRETVHHINAQRRDNRIENLYLFKSLGEHTSYHKGVEFGRVDPITKSNLDEFLTTRPRGAF